MIKKLELEMTKNQLEAIEKFVVDENECICGDKIKNKQKRCLFAIPVSSRMKSYVSVEGNLDIIAICETCFRKVNGEIVKIKQGFLK